MKKIYFLTVLLFSLFLAVCKADDYQPGYVILKDGHRVSGLIKLYKNAPWKNQRYIWFKDSAAYAANPSIHGKKYFSSQLKSYQAGSHTYVRVHYIDQSYINLRTLVNNYHMLERVSNGRIVSYLYYSYPPEILDMGDKHGDRVETGSDNQAMRYRIIFKKDGAKHFHNAYGYGLASYFKDTPQVLQKYNDGAYGNQPTVTDVSLYDRIAALCNRTIFTSQKETKGIIAAFNDYDRIYNPELAEPTPNAIAQFKPYIFKGTVINGTLHSPETDVTVTYVDSLTQQTVKQTLTNVNGVYEFLVENNRAFNIRIQKKGFVTKSLAQGAGVGINSLSGAAIGAGQEIAASNITGNGSASGNGSGTAANGSGNGSGSASNGSNNGSGLAANGSGNGSGLATNGSGNGSGLAANGSGYGSGSATNGSGNGSGLAANGSGNGSGSSIVVGSTDGLGSGSATGGTFVSPAVSLEPMVPEQTMAANPSVDGSGQLFTSNKILYDFGHASLRAEAIPVLDSLVKQLEDQPKLTVTLTAHTDSVGSDAYNLKLSQERAKLCADYLISKGISTSRISSIGYGRAKPIAPNTLPNGQDNPDGRQLNRRLEFTVKESDSRMAKLANN
jgi:outer membrane protein OmpA-like peptidoglycan-associated protein